MQTYVNGTRPTTIQTIPTIEQADVRADLDAWDSVIGELDTAMQDAADARLSLDRLHRKLEAIEAGHVLSIDGGNAEQRKARLILELNDDAEHVRSVQAVDVTRAHLLDAERRVQVSKERCRLLRAAIGLGREG